MYRGEEEIVSEELGVLFLIVCVLRVFFFLIYDNLNLKSYVLIYIFLLDDVDYATSAFYFNHLPRQQFSSKR